MIPTATAARSHYAEIRARLHGCTTPTLVRIAPPPVVKSVRRGPKGRQCYAHPIGPVRLTRRGISINAIIDAVCFEGAIPRVHLLSSSRVAPLCEARQIGYYIARRLTGRSYPNIARHFAKDHTTVIYGAKEIERRLADDAPLRDRVRRVIEIVEARR